MACASNISAPMSPHVIYILWNGGNPQIGNTSSIKDFQQFCATLNLPVLFAERLTGEVT